MDIALQFDERTQGFDLAIADGDLALDDGLETAVFLSLFTDRRADADDTPPDGSRDRRGYWTDPYYPHPAGSKLWLLRREKRTIEVVKRIEDYAAAALAWLTDSGYADSVDVHAEPLRRNAVALRVRVTKDRVALLQRIYAYEFDRAV